MGAWPMGCPYRRPRWAVPPPVRQRGSGARSKRGSEEPGAEIRGEKKFSVVPRSAPSDSTSPHHESHQPGAVGQELLRGRLLPLGAKFGHRSQQQQQEPGVGGTHESAVRYERLLLQIEGVGAGHPAGHQAEPGGNPPARHRLYLRPADRAGRGGQGARPLLGGHPAVPEGSRAGLRAVLQRREKFVSLTPPPSVPISKHAPTVGSRR